MIVDIELLRDSPILLVFEIRLSQNPVDALRIQNLKFLSQSPVPVHPKRRHCDVQTFHVDSVNHRLHCNVTCKIPEFFLSLSSRIHMRKQTMEQHMEIGAIYMHTPALVETTQIIGIIINDKAVRPDSPTSRHRLKSETAQRDIEITHIQIKLISRIHQNSRAEFHRIQLIQLSLSDRINHG